MIAPDMSSLETQDMQRNQNMAEPFSKKLSFQSWLNSEVSSVQSAQIWLGLQGE